jgi:hypothetical protein
MSVVNTHSNASVLELAGNSKDSKSMVMMANTVGESLHASLMHKCCEGRAKRLKNMKNEAKLNMK